MIFRDYGLFDHAMLRFSKGHKISDHFYVRQDGTRAYYFTLGETHIASHLRKLLQLIPSLTWQRR